MGILYIRDKNGNFIEMPSIPGKSAYEIAVERGTFSGTEQEFAEMQVINNKDIIDQITQENINSWNNKSTFDGNYNNLTNKPNIPTKVSNLQNDSGFITEIPNEYITEEELDSKGYLTEHQDISNLATKEELFNKDYNDLINKPNIPTHTSELENDSNYISEIPNEYITETELENTINNIEKTVSSDIQPVDNNVTLWINTSEDEATTVARINDNTVASNTTWSSEKINASITSGGSGNVDLSAYALKTELPTATSQLTNDSNFITSIPSEYVTEIELTAKGYLTEHQDISGKADKTELHNHTNKTVLDNITSEKVTEWNNKSTFDGNYNSLTNKPTIPTIPTNISAFTNDKGYLTSVPSEYINETELQTHTDQVLSAGEQLVLNGSQVLQNNYNFSQLKYDGAVANNSGGSLLGGVGKRQDIISDYFFAINPNKPVYASFDVKGAVGSKMYAFVDFYDVDKQRISASTVMYQPNTLTRLTQDLKKGDTVVHLEDLTNWKENLTATYQRSFIFWNYTNKKGYTYPPETYSRNTHQNLYTDSSSVDKTNNTITLSTAWDKGTYPAGTYVSQGGNGNNYRYIKAGSLTVDTEWKTISGVYEGIDYTGTNIQSKLPPGTAFAKFGMFLNYGNVANEKVWITNIVVKEDIYSAIEEKADKTELHNHSNKTVLDGITSAKITEWNNKSTFDGNYNSLTNKPIIPSIEGLATEDYVNQEIEKIDVTSQLGDYAKKTDIPTVPTKISQLENDNGYLTNDNLDYVTPQMYGAIADGEHNDTTAVQFALNSGKSVYFPAGRYKVTSLLQVTNACKISMYKPYPCTYKGDYPLSENDNHMGARIETYSTNGGMLIGDGVEIDGLNIRAMNSFVGVLFKFDGTLGQSTYPSRLRISHVTLENNSIDTVPEAMFDFIPNGTYYHVLEDITIGSLRGRQFAEYGFRSIMTTNDTNWANSVRIRNLCIDILADYPLYIEGGKRGAENWVFENPTIQSCTYVIDDPTYLGKTGHKAIVTFKNLQNPLILGGDIYDLHASNYEKVFDIVNCSKISCFGSNIWDEIDTNLKGKLQEAADNLNIEDLTMSTESDLESGGNYLKLSDGTNEQSVLIPGAVIDDNQLGNSIAKWMEEVATVREEPGKNKYNPDDPDTKLGVYYHTGQFAYEGDGAHSSNFIKTEYGDIIRMSKNGTPMAAYYTNYFDENFVFITRKNTSSNNGANEITVENTKYIRLTWMPGTFTYDDRHNAKICITVNDADISYEAFGLVEVGGIDQYLQQPIPTKTSQLTNDSGFLTETKLEEKMSDLSLGIHSDGLLYIFYNENPIGNGINININNK